MTIGGELDDATTRSSSWTRNGMIVSLEANTRERGRDAVVNDDFEDDDVDRANAMEDMRSDDSATRARETKDEASNEDEGDERDDATRMYVALRYEL